MGGARRCVAWLRVFGVVHIKASYIVAKRRSGGHAFGVLAVRIEPVEGKATWKVYAKASTQCMLGREEMEDYIVSPLIINRRRKDGESQSHIEIWRKIF